MTDRELQMIIRQVIEAKTVTSATVPSNKVTRKCEGCYKDMIGRNPKGTEYARMHFNCECGAAYFLGYSGALMRIW